MGKVCKIALIFLFLGFSPKIAGAATLSFLPSTGSFTVGGTFSVGVYVLSANQSINATSGVVSFPKDKLEVVSLSKAGSIFSLWIQEPSFSNSIGVINFEGIIFNPGFLGASGKVIAINFKVKAAGTAPISFSSGSVLANDGTGTNVLESLGIAQFNLSAAPQTPPTTPGVPSAPQIFSPTHPDPNKWYSKKEVKFTWVVPSDVTSVRLLYNKNPDSQPSVVYSPSISEKQLDGIDDGVYYFHVQFRNSHGWGEVSHFRFQIDTQPPEPFSIELADGKETINLTPVITFNAVDALSKIDYYQIKVGESGLFKIDPAPIGPNFYTLPLQYTGKQVVVVEAHDKAGNITIEKEDFEILPVKTPQTTMQIGAVVITILAIVIPLVALFVILFWYARHKSAFFKKRFKKEVREAESSLHKTFDSLGEDIREQIKMMEKTRTKRQLTAEEEKIIKQLKRKLDSAEKVIKNEIKDIKDVIQ